MIIVSQALVLASGSENNKQLIAYLCGVGELDDISIATLLSSKLPDYMIPSGYIWLDSFPVNSNGKIDRRALPSPDLTSEEKYVAPETNDQQKLVKIWSEVLDLEEDTISITSDFFRLGGHSLLAITLTNKINQVFNIEVSLKDLFSYRTILELSTYISEKEHVQFESIPKALESSSYPLSSAQRRMYFLYEFDKGSTSYNMPMFYRVGRDLDVSQLDKVFKELVSRHQSLRTVFELEEGYPVQRVLEATNFNIAYKQGNPSDVDRYVSEFVQPFNLAEELPYRVSLIDITGEDYLLMIDSHHIINDGVSNEILMKGFWSLYHGESLPSLSIDYIDYSVWQQSEGYQDLVSSHKTYWLDKYSEELTALELPTDYPRSQDQSTEGDVHSITLSKKQSEELRKIAASEGVTMYTLFLGIYTILLSKLSNQEDIVVGTPTAGRHHADLEEVVGMFVNTLALRNQVASGTSFQEFLSELQVNTLMAFDHQLYQYEELVDALDVSRDSGRNPLFDVFYSYNQYQEVTDVEESESLKIVGHDVSYTIAKFDLMLDVLDSESIVLSLNYRTDLYSSSSIARFSGYLNKIIDSVLDNKEKQLKDIDILSTSEKDRLLLGLNTTKVNYDLEETVLDMFRSKVEEFPNSIALVMEGKKLTYQELDARSDLWATHLMNLGVLKGSIVGLMMTRSLEMITGILGIMKAGGAYLPINVDQPLSRTHHMLEECKVSFVLSNLNDLSEEIKANYSYLSSSVLDKKLNVNKKELPVVTSDDAAYVIYTSGSTGNPKGVLVAYKGITNLNCFQREFFDIGTADRILQFSPYYFDASVEQIWLALTSGGKMVLIGREVLLDPTLFKNYLLENKITYLHSTPSFLENLPIDELPFLKIVISGGEKCTPSLANKFLGKSRFINEYGPTEGTVVSMAYEVLEKLNTNVPIGRPIANTQAYILDKDLNLLPEGTIGELYIGGVHLAEGYVNNVTLTEERFIGNPFGKGSLYKTGDLVKWLPEGDLEYLGRNDHQVKIRGYRIELGEIESVLEEVPSINQALVLAHGTGVNKQLVAYLCCNEVIEEQDIILLLSGMLPDYMVPLSYIYLDSFPLNANGKIDRKSLPIPNLIDKEAYVAPTNETETSLVHIWSEILDLEENAVSITSDFFRLGGHSLLAITLLNKVNKIFNVEVSLRDLFSYRTILELSTYILEKDHVQFESIPKALESESYPLSSAQRRMYFLYEYEKDGTSYNMPTFYRVGRDLDVSQLDKAFKELVSRHQVLRTVFELIDGHPVQQVLKDVNFEIDYKQGAASDIKNYVSEFVQPFNLAENLPYRVSLIDITGEDYLLMIDSHHIINDGVSNGILTRDIWSLYYGESLPNLSIEYIDYSVWQQSESYQDLVSNHKKYWLDKYREELTALELPTDYPRSQVRNNEGGVHSLILNKKQSEELRKIAASEGVTMYTLFLGIYTILLSKLSNQEDIVIGTPTAGRLHADMEDVVGMFVNTLALRNQVTSGTSFQDFLSGLQTDTLMAFDHQLFQYEELVDALDVSRDSGRNPLFDVFYSYNQEKTYVEESERLKVVGYEVDYNVAKFDLELDVVEQEEGCGIFFSYSLSLFNEKTIERFSKGFEKIIAEILVDKEIEISKINILSNEESNQIIKEFNAPEINYNIKGTIVDLIEKQVLLNPLAEALYYKGYTMSYQDLNLKVNQLTHYLIKVIKVKKGDRIGVYLGRSPEMIISFLAVLKSGATYIALDSNNPLDRLKMLIDGSEMKYILTNLSTDLVNLETSVSVIDLIIDKVKIEKMPEINPLLSIKGNDTAYIIFTSGSTGKPKGVIIEHNSLVDYSITFKKYFSLTPLDKVIQQASPSFDTVVEEIFPALLTGASLVIMPEGGRDIEALIHGIKETKATVLTTVPVVLDVLNKYSDDLQSLRFIVSGGDVLLPRHIDNLINHYPIFNTYGPSESTVCITYHEIDSLEKTSCIGKPINNRQVYILNEAKQLCPIGVPGELYVSGKGLAKGYLNDDKLTENKFIENPVIPGVRAYATGDLAKWNEDGTIDFLGRIDNQIKIRGLRIELGEIEYQLEKIESINKSLVIASGEGESKQLVAYLCGNINIEESSIKNILSSKLPNYMIPTTYIKVDNFPVNSNGKIDRKLLPSPNFTTGSEYIAPNNEVQKKLLSIWSEVLRAKESEISITSDFFKLGGHSLLAMEMKHKISKYMNAEFQLSEIFLAPTIASLSLKIEQKKNEDIKVVDVIPLNKRETEDKLFVIHDGSGEVDGYLELTRNIKEYQCYGIKFEHDYDIISAPSINEIASVYIEKIKSIQPTGPYNLLGWSLGGEIATEIALQLETYNEKVEKLIIIDSYLGYEKPAKETLFNVDSELELFSSLFSFNPINKQEFYSLKGLQDELFNSEPFKALTSNQMQDLIPQSIKQLIPDYINKTKEELFTATSKIRLLVASSDNNWINKQVKANTLYICPSQSINNQNIDKLKSVFVNINISNIPGDHFSIMKAPRVMPLSNLINKHFELTLVSLE
ncbi:amino acid adenylation domain-containing protein [Tenacibaculum sp. MAR_2010_89]|uniref:non-ribosomal peptide synthetase n=1 Tax=Tenacibaculum sp. MAR_2010_89 TaxID=1250198 RepID=UPI000896DD08|nr:non-ribosomal peptide synthetase [Tenacibaculum sp. MAR_2010_89]SEE23267.1 amino acid adenylation domain-containing protein [Tenacibaculum sp. MAR_2010_89]